MDRKEFEQIWRNLVGSRQAKNMMSVLTNWFLESTGRTGKLPQTRLTHENRKRAQHALSMQKVYLLPPFSTMSGKGKNAQLRQV